LTPRPKQQRDLRFALKFPSRAAWRRWLEKNHASRKEALLVISKRAPFNSRFSSRDALEEALCHGWIDGWFNPLDNDRWVIRYTPRRKGSNWSKYNVATARKLMHEGKMTPAGVARLPDVVLEIWEEHRPVVTVATYAGGPQRRRVEFTDGRDYLALVKFPVFSP
jgi:uncharacterized protein YdeI (YjbR/CyaY-like superfamily)